eukprot:689469-Prorocentrum_minimum.AAC.3
MFTYLLTDATDFVSAERKTGSAYPERWEPADTEPEPSSRSSKRHKSSRSEREPEKPSRSEREPDKTLKRSSDKERKDRKEDPRKDRKEDRREERRDDRYVTQTNMKVKRIIVDGSKDYHNINTVKKKLNEILGKYRLIKNVNSETNGIPLHGKRRAK